jgi:hypothetical protein
MHVVHILPECHVLLGDHQRGEFSIKPSAYREPFCAFIRAAGSAKLFATQGLNICGRVQWVE